MDVRFLQIDSDIIDIGDNGALTRIKLHSDRAVLFVIAGDVLSVMKDTPAYDNLMRWLYPQTLTLHASREEWRIPAPEPSEPAMPEPDWLALQIANARKALQPIAANPEDADELQKALAARRTQAREIAAPEFSAVTLNESKLISDVLATLEIYQEAHPGCNCMRCVWVDAGVHDMEHALAAHVPHLGENV